MQRHVLLSLTAAILAFTAAGCGDAGSAPPGEDAADTSGGDTATEDAAATDTSRPPGFELGSNPQGRNEPSAFVPLGEGDDLEIVLGPQGLWMVVLAFRTRGLVAAPLYLDADITVDGVRQGVLVLQDQPLFPGPEGWNYYYNFFLVVDDPTVTGRPATVAFRVTDKDGVLLERALGVTLTGGL